MRFRHALITTLFCALFAPSAQASNILELFDYHGDEVITKPGQKWLGLYALPGGKYELRATPVNITMVQDQIIDEDPKAKTGKRISVPGKEKPIYVIGGVAGLKAGAVTAGSTLKKEHLEVDQKLPLKVGTNQATLVIAGKKKGEYRTGYSITLVSGGIKQVIMKANQIGGDTAPSLLWSGDLDGDGKLDLIMDTTDNYNVSNTVLLLSGKAKPGKLVQEVAKQYSTGC
jgi:hypothetical protein